MKGILLEENISENSKIVETYLKLVKFVKLLSSSQSSKDACTKKHRNYQKLAGDYPL